MTQTIKLAVIPGDGIGKEVVPEGLKVLERALEGTGVTVRPTTFDLGAERWHRTGQTLTDEDLEAIKAHDAILLGAVGDPSVPSGVLERGLLLRLRFALDHYVNLRPSVYYPGVPTPLGLILPEAASPMPPVTAPASSVRMSPKRLSVTMTSKRPGSVTM